MKKSKKEKSNALKDRLKRSYDSKDKGGSNRPQAFDWKKAGDIKFYKPKEGKNKINIIPYIVKTKNDPLVRAGDAKIGDESYMLDIWVHRNVGPTQAEVICPKSNFSKPCPICKQAQEFKDAGKKDEASALWPKRQCLYNVQDAKNPEAGIQVFAISHFLFEKELIEEARAASDDGDIIDFVDIDDGKMVTFRAAEETSNINGKAVTYLSYKSFGFAERDEALDPEMVEQATSFDELMKLPTDKEIEALLFGEDDDSEDDEDEKPAKKDVKKTSKKPDPDEDDDEDEEEESDDEEDDDDDSEEDDDEDEEEEKPAKKAVKKAPPAKETKAPKKGVCPEGHKFGIDCDKKDECEDCEMWADCTKEQMKLKKKK